MAKSSLSSSSILTDEVIIILTDISIDRMNNQIGKGGFGKVYKYYDEQKEDVFAYKIYDPNIFQDSEPAIMKKRFLREGKKLLNYSHANVVKLLTMVF
ncbi:protein kinase domain-containing protein [Anaerocolumna xylanovorans]|uniref:Protein kinase domain-containing protein n=1 Tax=Anaerocolumna xylanovorans DSM 12503 TaxID=1121345 RepID=A0A1M7Y7S1_9FIRM|nr:protein kinase [Anaerocolumna xylanovorans]SHO48695.1 Protein kinase domain-containing protein [Anaerocolumna xylanovorans DSM 12503]